MHARTLRHLGTKREAWMSNMVPELRREGGEDEMAEMRADLGRLQGPRPRQGESREGRSLLWTPQKRGRHQRRRKTKAAGRSAKNGGSKGRKK